MSPGATSRGFKPIPSLGSLDSVSNYTTNVTLDMFFRVYESFDDVVGISKKIFCVFNVLM